MKLEPRPSLNDLTFTCDWGDCNAPTVDARWSASHGWLPVCVEHRPRRIQRRRTKGWKMPAEVVYVGRPTPWHNPFRVGDIIADPMNGYNPIPGYPMPHDIGVFERQMWDGTVYTQTVREVVDAADAVELFRRVYEFEGYDLSPLRGRDLACWCPLDQPCHADVLLELANGGTS